MERVEEKTPVGLDFETRRFGAGAVAPAPVCLAAALPDGKEWIDTGDEMRATLELLLADDSYLLVWHNVGFDLPVAINAWPELTPLIFAALDAGRIHDTEIRERLLHVSTHGRLEMELPDGTAKKIRFTLADLEKRYLQRDRSGEKNDDDAWRTNYQLLEDVPLKEWPNDAIAYAIADARGCLEVWQAQERVMLDCHSDLGPDRSKWWGPCTVGTQELQSAARVSLGLMAAWGFEIDADEKRKIEELLERELHPSKMANLIANGIFRPAQPPRAYKNGRLDHSEECEARKTEKAQKALRRKKECGCPPKLTAGKAEGINDGKLRAWVKKTCEEQGLEVRMTDSGKVAADKEVIEDLWTRCPVLEEFRHRQGLLKLRTTEIPRMGDLGIVHPCYNILVETGRTSSFASKAYPSLNTQNIDRRARRCFRARAGSVLYSADYSYLELVTFAQKCLDLFRHSVLADKINAGYDPHAYLGSQLAAHLDSSFVEALVKEGIHGDEDATYRAFVALKVSDDEELRKFYKHYRNMAKPTGLGYPGGLGPATFCSFAKSQYKQTIEEDLAHELREIWRRTYPEAVEYHEWVNRYCRDPLNDDFYAYKTPLGMYRARTSFCAAANGAALQSPAAEGMKLAVYEVARACYDPNVGSCLYGTHPIALVHDEIVGEIPEDRWMHERAFEVSRIMVSSMRVVCPDVKVTVAPALMRNWDKNADTVFDAEGRLAIWEPENGS